MRPTYGGFSLSTRTKLERSGHIAGFPLTSERADRTDARNARSSDAIDVLGQIRNVKFTPQMDFLDMMTEYQPLQHGQSLTQFLLRDM